MKFACYILLLQVFILLSGQVTEEEIYQLRIGKYKIPVIKAETAEVYAIPSKVEMPQIVVKHPPQKDSVKDAGSGRKVAVTRDRFVINRLVDSIPLRYLDTLLKSEIRVFRNGKLQPFVTALSVEAFQASGEMYSAEYNGSRMGENAKLIYFLKKRPAGSYLVLNGIYLYNNNKKRVVIEDRVGWKIMN